MMKNNRFSRENILTIPNLISLFRILLIPLIIWLYCGKKQYAAMIFAIAISGVSHIIDGRIARRYNMVSDVGKVLDPIADKLTQAALVICLIARYPWIWALLALFAVKECLMLLSLVMYGRFYHEILDRAPSVSKQQTTLRTARNVVFSLIWVGIIAICFIHRKELSAEGIARYTPRNPWLAWEKPPRRSLRILKRTDWRQVFTLQSTHWNT